MIDTVEELKEKRPDLVELFEGMTKEQLLNQCYLECIDAINMEERVSIFMEECTDNMSHTNYSISALSTLINNKKELEIDEFCYYETVDEPTAEELLESILKRAEQYKK